MGEIVTSSLKFCESSSCHPNLESASLGTAVCSTNKVQWMQCSILFWRYLLFLVHILFFERCFFLLRTSTLDSTLPPLCRCSGERLGGLRSRCSMPLCFNPSNIILFNLAFVSLWLTFFPLWDSTFLPPLKFLFASVVALTCYRPSPVSSFASSLYNALIFFS